MLLLSAIPTVAYADHNKKVNTPKAHKYAGLPARYVSPGPMAKVRDPKIVQHHIDEHDRKMAPKPKK